MNLYARFIYFLVRRYLHVTMWEPFQFTNQKHCDFYYFSDEGFIRRGNGIKRPSDVPLNWLLSPECEIRYVCEPNRKHRDSKNKIKIITIALAIIGLFVAGILTYMAQAYFYDVVPESNTLLLTDDISEPFEEPIKDYASIRESTRHHGQPAEIDIFQPPYSYKTESAEETHDNSEEITHIEPLESPSEAVDEPESEENDSYVNLDDVELLARVIYQEAGGDAACDECRRRVADVVLNRVADDRFPDSIYDVLTQENQYGEFAWTGVVWADRADNPGEAEAVERARRIAAEVLSGQHSDVYGNGYVWQAGFEQGTEGGFWHCGHFYGR